MKMFPLGGTCSWTCKALGLTGDSFLLGWVHQLMSVDGIARREARELCKWRPSQITEHFFPSSFLVMPMEPSKEQEDSGWKMGLQMR